MFPNKYFSHFHLKYDKGVFLLENVVGFSKLFWLLISHFRTHRVEKMEIRADFFPLYLFVCFKTDSLVFFQN